MKKNKFFLIFTFIIVLHGFLISDPLTRIYVNGQVFTGAKGVLNEALVIRGNRIIFTGRKEKALRFSSGKGSIVVDLKGKTIIPGFHDADTNFPLGARLMDSQMNFFGLDLDSIVHRLQIAKKNLIKQRPIYAYNFEHLLRNKGKWPNRYDLDKVSVDSPIIIFSSDGNNAWVNSIVLKQCGIKKNTKELPGGRIVRFEDGNPTGIICGDSTELLNDYKYKNGLRNIKLDKEKIIKTIKFANNLGITSITTHSDLEFVKILKELESEKILNLRFNIILPSKNIGGYLIKKIDFNNETPFVRIVSVSKNIDGNLYTSDAAMFTSYSDRNYYGILRSNKNDISDLVSLYKKNNIIGNFYAEGERAVNIVLNGIRASSRRKRQNIQRNRISNFIFVIDEDIPRLKFLSVIPVTRPGAFINKSEYLERLVGQRKSATALRMATLRKLGVHIAFGSGWPGESFDPLLGLKFSVFRNTGGDSSGDDGAPEEKLSIREGIIAYTYVPSYSVLDENRTGSIAAGKFADLTIIGGDLFSEKLNGNTFLSEIHVIETIIGGKTVYKKSEIN